MTTDLTLIVFPNSLLHHRCALIRLFGNCVHPSTGYTQSTTNIENVDSLMKANRYQRFKDRLSEQGDFDNSICFAKVEDEHFQCALKNLLLSVISQAPALTDVKEHVRQRATLAA